MWISLHCVATCAIARWFQVTAVSPTPYMLSLPSISADLGCRQGLNIAGFSKVRPHCPMSNKSGSSGKLPVVAVIGAGFLGKGIAGELARCGCTVHIYDVSADWKDDTQPQIAAQLSTFVVSGGRAARLSCFCAAESWHNHRSGFSRDCRQNSRQGGTSHAFESLSFTVLPVRRWMSA